MIPGKAGRKEGALARDLCSVSSAVRCSSCLLSSDLWNHPFLKSHLVTPDPGTSFFLLPPFSHLSYPSSSPSPPPSVLELSTNSLPSIFRVSMPHTCCFTCSDCPFTTSIVEGGLILPGGMGRMESCKGLRQRKSWS